MTVQEFNQLKHDLRNSVNHILGYSQLIEESAVDSSDESAARRAENIQAYGRLLAGRIDELSLAELSNVDRSKAFRLAFLPLVEQILQAASSGGGSSGASLEAADLQKICQAANRLMALVSAP